MNTAEFIHKWTNYQGNENSGAVRYADQRRKWIDSSAATEAKLKERTLTNLYNQRPTWLQNLHAALDRAVWEANVCSVEEFPAEVEGEVKLERLLALNLERASESKE